MLSMATVVLGCLVGEGAGGQDGWQERWLCCVWVVWWVKVLGRWKVACYLEVGCCCNVGWWLAGVVVVVRCEERAGCLGGGCVV